MIARLREAAINVGATILTVLFMILTILGSLWGFVMVILLVFGVFGVQFDVDTANNMFQASVSLLYLVGFTMVFPLMATVCLAAILSVIGRIERMFRNETP